jgi:DNA mismatch endonuclease (patch repair protein)
MADSLTPEQRHRSMAAIKSKNTTPERMVRSAMHARGYRFRLHRRDLPGKPDIVLPKHKSVIFVNGCFWHQHPGCKEGRVPTVNVDYWRPKLIRNRERDVISHAALLALGWRVIVIWDCQVKKALMCSLIEDIEQQMNGPT